MSLSTLNKPTSPWLDSNLENLFRTELSYAREPIGFYGYRCHPALKWVDRNNASKLLYNGLAKFAPLCPIVAYKEKTSAYVSPPLSGYNNSALMILGRDSTGKKRLIGSNYANWPTGGCSLPKSNFFDEFDQLTSRTAREGLIFNTVSSHMTYEDISIAKTVAYQSALFRTMPVALLVLDGEKSHMAFCPAVVYGSYPCDMSLEFLGEVL